MGDMALVELDADVRDQGDVAKFFTSKLCQPFIKIGLVVGSLLVLALVSLIYSFEDDFFAAPTLNSQSSVGKVANTTINGLTLTTLSTNNILQKVSFLFKGHIWSMVAIAIIIALLVVLAVVLSTGLGRPTKNIPDEVVNPDVESNTKDCITDAKAEAKDFAVPPGIKIVIEVVVVSAIAVMFVGGLIRYVGGCSLLAAKCKNKDNEFKNLSDEQLYAMIKAAYDKFEKAQLGKELAEEDVQCFAEESNEYVWFYKHRVCHLTRLPSWNIKRYNEAYVRSKPSYVDMDIPNVKDLEPFILYVWASDGFLKSDQTLPDGCELKAISLSLSSIKRYSHVMVESIFYFLESLNLSNSGDASNTNVSSSTQLFC